MTHFQRLRRGGYGLLLLWSLLALVGCGQQSYGVVRFKSEPAGAEVINLANDSLLGTTPLDVIWEGEGSEEVTVEFRKRGYLEKIITLWVNKRHDTREAAYQQPQPITVELEKKD